MRKNNPLYVGRRGGIVTVHGLMGTRYLEPRPDLVDHGAPRFAWGYGGTGAAQLALALLADALRDDERALRLYEDFKRRRVAKLDPAGWNLFQSGILVIAADIEQAQAQFLERRCA